MAKPNEWVEKQVQTLVAMLGSLTKAMDQQKKEHEYQRDEDRRQIDAQNGLLAEVRCRVEMFVAQLRTQLVEANYQKDRAHDESRPLRESFDDLKERYQILSDELSDVSVVLEAEVHTRKRVEADLSVAMWTVDRLNAERSLDRYYVPEWYWCPACHEPYLKDQVCLDCGFCRN